jgi:sugar O-acyltransferase (sialic acid O-acetyltransferase NeuD family)
VALMKSELLGIFGARGHGRDTLLFASEAFGGEIVFIDDAPEGKDWNGVPVLTFPEFCRMTDRRRRIAIAIGDCRSRSAVWDRVVAENIEICSVKAPSSSVWPGSQIGAGALISPHVVISAGVSVGRGLIANTMSSIAHDCQIGDFVTLAPGALCNGCVHIGDFATIGAGALIKQGTLDTPRRIGKGAIIGMGAVVTRDVDDFETVVGNPARAIANAT